MSSFLGRLKQGCARAGLAYVAISIGIQVVMASTTALASSVQRTVLEIAVNGQVDYASLQSQARAMATTALTQGFAQDPAVQEQTVAVIASRNGEIVPLLQVTVSRNQWLTTPQVEQWASQYSSAYALVLRQGGEPAVLAQSSTPARRDRSVLSRMERALDNRTLSGQVAQDYLSDLD